MGFFGEAGKNVLLSILKFIHDKGYEALYELL